MIVVLGLGVVWQIPRHDGAMPPTGESHADSPADARRVQHEGASATTTAAEVVGPYRTIALEVTGMT